MYMFVVDTMQRLYRLFKCRLHCYYKTCGKTDDERKKNPPLDLPPLQWEYLIKHYGSECFKAASVRNSKNRNSDKRVKHTTGNLSSPESEDILDNLNVVASVGDSKTQEEILIQVLGQRSSYIRGKGIAVRGYAKGKAQAEERKLVQQKQSKIQMQEQKIKELEESQLKQQAELDALKQTIYQQLLNNGV